MAKKEKTKLKPVAIAGIEFDALIEQQKTMSASIPVYPVEEGFPVSDTITLDPLTLQMTLFVTNTPVTWLKRHGHSQKRVRQICKKLEDLWLERKLVKIVTPDAIYKDMGITSISIKKSADLGYSREVSITAQKVRKTKKKTVKIPKYALKSGETKAKAGAAQTSKESAASSSVSEASTEKDNMKQSSSGKGSSNSTSAEKSSAKKGQSILYGVAKGLKFI